MKKDVKYYAVYDLRKVVATTQRTASVSMIESLAPAHERSNARQITMGEAFALKQLGWPILLWIRYPLERLACAYHIFGRDCTLVEFLERAMREMNPHWSSVTLLHTRGKEFLPTTVYTFDNLADTWAIELPGYELQHVGANLERPTWYELREDLTYDFQQRLYEHWRNDFSLYDWADDNGLQGHKVAA